MSFDLKQFKLAHEAEWFDKKMRRANHGRELQLLGDIDLLLEQKKQVCVQAAFFHTLRIE